jgi:choline transport protein
MIGIFFVNMVFTIACWLVLCFAMPDTGAALEHISTYPVIYILEQSMSTKWVTVELVLIIALVLFANVCYITAVSRDLWAFARDNGLPFSPWICKVCGGQRESSCWSDYWPLPFQIHPKYLAPVNAIYVTALFSFLLSLIYIGSETAFYAITSLMTVALLQCYMFSIGSILWRRIYLPDTIPESSFSLGRWGIPINSVAFIWCMWSFVSPNLLAVESWSFNWQSVLVLVFLAASYAYNGGRLQLGVSHLRSRHRSCDDLLCLRRAKELPRASGPGEKDVENLHSNVRQNLGS